MYGPYWHQAMPDTNLSTEKHDQPYLSCKDYT